MESTEAQIPTLEPEAKPHRRTGSGLYRWLVVAAFLAGLLSSYLAWGRQSASPAPSASTTASRADTAASRLDVSALMKQVNPVAGYKLPVRYGDLGPRLLEGGAIDYAAFAAVFEQGGDPLTPQQVQALKAGSDEPIVITQQNAHFLLNFFWAVGLANKNTILTDGPMVQNSGGRF